MTANRKKTFIFLCFIACIVLACFNYKYNQKRLSYIIDIPIEAFDNDGNLIDKQWIKFLKKQKPVGIIFFKDHFQDKKIAKNIIDSVKNVIKEKYLFLSADMEGGRVNRMAWQDFPSAQEIAEKYLDIKLKSGEEKAKKFVKDEYSKMFKEMQDIGLNLNFAPNLDINIYNNINKNSKEYKNYKMCEKYVLLSRKPISKMTQEEKDLYSKVMMFYAYLDEVNIRNLDRLAVDGKIAKNEEFITKIRNKWKDTSKQNKEKLINEFEPLTKYINYISVIGDRSYGNDVKLIAELGEIFIDTAKQFNIKCVLKHALGHGRTAGDTHQNIEIVNTSKEQIIEDIYPYKKLINKTNFVMPSYVIYNSIDNKNTAMTSKKVVEFFHQNVSQDVVFIGDDMSMGSFEANKEQICNIHIKTHNKKPNDILKFVHNNDYVKQSTLLKWFK